MCKKSLEMILAINEHIPHEVYYPLVTQSYHQLGFVYEDQGKLKQAEEMYIKSLEMELAMYGSDRPHPKVASTYHNLGSIYQD